MMIRFKKILGTICCAAMLVGISACSSGKDAKGDALEMQTGMATGSIQLKALTKEVNAFMKENPGTKINLVPGTASYESDLKVRLAARNTPDIWNTHGWSRDRYAEFLEPLQNRPWASKMVKVADPVLMKADKSFYALPMDVAVTGIIYNKTVLQNAGVDARSIGSWDDFDAACQKIVATGASCLAASGKENFTSGNIADYMSSGIFTEAQLTAMKKGTFDSKAYEKGVTRVYQWARNKYFNPDYTSATADDAAKLAAADKVGFVFIPSSFAQTTQTFNKDVKLGVMPYPSAVGKPYMVTGEDYAYGVSKTSKHKDVALKLIDYLAQPKHMQGITDTTNNTPSIEGVKANVGQLKEDYDYWLETQKVPTSQIFDRVYLPNGMWNTLCTTTDGLITGQSNPESAAKQMKTSFDSLYKKQ